MKIFCPKCNEQIDSTDSFCPCCGCKINNDSIPNSTELSKIESKQLPQEIDNPKRLKKNPFVKCIFITIAVQIVLFIISTTATTVGGISFGVAFFVLPVAILTFSIISIVKSKKYNKKGLVIGVVFTVLSSLLVLIISVAAVMGIVNHDSENDYINDYINTAATNSVDNLKSSLKDPNSLKINKIYARAYDARITARLSDGTYYDGGDFKGYFEIYIDCTATNGFGGAVRKCYCYTWSQDMICTEKEEIENMPPVNDGVQILNAEKYNKLAQNLPVHY